MAAKDRYYVISGKLEPVVMVDEAGDPAYYPTEAAAIKAANDTPMCRAFGYVVVVCDGNGIEVAG